MHGYVLEVSIHVLLCYDLNVFSILQFVCWSRVILVCHRALCSVYCSCPDRLTPSARFLCSFFVHIIYVFVYLVRDRVSGTQYVYQAGLELKDWPASASQELGSQVCATTFFFIFALLLLSLKVIKREIVKYIYQSFLRFSFLSPVKNSVAILLYKEYVNISLLLRK